VPLRHFGSLHSITDAATGGTPLVQSGSVQVSAAVGRVPLRHFGSLHSIADATGGTPLIQSGVVQALAAAAVRPSEPTATAAEKTAPAATRQT